jgi:hypothetical protein
MKTSHEIITELNQFYGSATHYKHWLGLKYTDGVQYLAQEANCYWLLDAIASHQTKNLLSDPRLREFQIWHLQVKDNSAVLICEWDTNKKVLRQEIEYTDFPLSHLKLYLVEKVLMLTNEY